MFWPVDLSIFYRHLGISLPPYQVWLSAGSLLLISWMAIRLVRKRPYIAFGWLWYLITLLPVIGIIQVGDQSMADRYTYIPLIGLFVIVGFAVPDLATSLLRKRRKEEKTKASSRPVIPRSTYFPISIFAPLSIIIIMALFVLTYRQVALWRDTVTLFSHAVKMDDNNYLAHSTYGVGLKKQGLIDEAAAHYRRAVELRPEHAEGWNNLAQVYVKQKKLDDAIDAFRMALKYWPDNPAVNSNLAQAFEWKGNFAQAIVYYTKALALNPEDWKAHLCLGIILQREGTIQEAIRHLSAAIRLKPDIFEAHVNLGIALGALGKHDEAILHLKEAVRLSPKNTFALNNYGVALLNQGRIDDAIVRLAEALEINSRDAFAHKNLAIAMYYKGRYADAWNEVHESSKYGGVPDPKFLKFLSQKMPEPKQIEK